MASALALQCSTNLAMTTHTLGKGQFVEFILTREWTKATINKQHKNAILCTAYYLHTPSTNPFLSRESGKHLQVTTIKINESKEKKILPQT